MRTKLSALLLGLLFLISANSFAQSFYEIKFTDKAYNKYHGFMVYTSESEIYMRVKYQNSRGESRLVNVEYVAKTGTLDDGTYYYVMLGSNPSFISEKSSDENYNPDYFVWTRKSGEEFGLPYVTDDPDFAEESFQLVDVYTELDPNSLTKDYLRQFYNSDERDYQALGGMVDDGLSNLFGGNNSNTNYSNDNTNYSNSNNNDGGLMGNMGNNNTTNTNTTNDNNNYTNTNTNSNNDGGLMGNLGNSNNTNTNTTNTNTTNTNTNSNNTNSNNTYSNNNTTNNNTNTNTTYTGKVTLHLIIAANTRISDIGASCEIDKKKIIHEMEDVAAALNITLKQYIVEGENFTKSNMQSTLNNFSPGPNDVVIFVYTGHGFRWSDQTGKFPQLDFRTSPYTQITNETCMNLEDINTKILGKGARLNIVLGDCCNADIGVNQSSNDRFLVSKSDPNYNEQKLAKLFLKSKGNVLATAASPGEVSWSNESDGGFFMHSFFQAFHEEIGYLSDEPTWDEVMANTIKYAAYKTSPSGCNGCTSQNGIKNVKVTY